MIGNQIIDDPTALPVFWPDAALQVQIAASLPLLILTVAWAVSWVRGSGMGADSSAARVTTSKRCTSTLGRGDLTPPAILVTKGLESPMPRPHLRRLGCRIHESIS